MPAPSHTSESASETTGLPLSRAFFETHKSTIMDHLPQELTNRLVIGLVGEGSECFGFDDEFSRDHDWGPAFCLWLPEAEISRWAPVLETALTELPDEFHGLPTRMRPDLRNGRVGLMSTESFYARFLRHPRVPQHWREWRAIPEHHYAVCTNGELFLDGPSETSTPVSSDFGAIRAGLLNHYPKELCQKKIATRCGLMAQAGQYNLLRSLKRKDTITATLCAAEFTRETLYLVHLLAGKFMPFYKWAGPSAARASLLGSEVASLLSGLLALDLSGGNAVHAEAEAVVEKICQTVINELYSQRLSGAAGSWLMDHAHNVQSRMTDPELKQIPIMLG